ncbi:uncharacterized protein [Musca autumnalis]|uniref:uncharacterized protein n=1 Tax=Musca autumnalis TaxID=221902 RepID=UPI003CFA4E5D
MEECIAESLTREEILKILEQRCIQLDGMYIMPKAELMRIYNTFAMPLSQRPQRHRHNGHNTMHADEQEMMIDNNDHVKMDIDIIPANDKINGHINEKNSTAEKRRTNQETLFEDYQYLSRATKRIKICASPEFQIP